MSLTSILNGKSTKEIELQSVIKGIIPDKNDFYNVSRKASFSNEYVYRVENKLKDSYEERLVEIAFAYSARFIVANFITRGKADVIKESIAEKGLEQISEKVDSQTKRRLEIKFNNGMRKVRTYINGSYILLTKDIIEFSCFLGKLEQFYRDGKLPEDINEVFFNGEREGILIELIKLSELFINKFIMNGLIEKDSKVIFNPHFGKISKKHGGACADIFVDGILYTFKANKDSEYIEKDVQQIIEYYILDCIAKKNKDNLAKLKDERIKNVAFYKARFGEIEIYNLSNIEDEDLKKTTKKIEKILKRERAVL